MSARRFWIGLALVLSTAGCRSDASQNPDRPADNADSVAPEDREFRETILALRALEGELTCDPVAYETIKRCKTLQKKLDDARQCPDQRPRLARKIAAALIEDPRPRIHEIYLLEVLGRLHDAGTFGFTLPQEARSARSLIKKGRDALTGFSDIDSWCMYAALTIEIMTPLLRSRGRDLGVHSHPDEPNYKESVVQFFDAADEILASMEK